MTTKNELLQITIPATVAGFISIDISAILGAFVGAVLYTAIASDSSMKKRAIFMLASFTAGYLGSPLFDAVPTGFMAFLISAVIVGLVLLFNKVVNKLSVDNVIDLIKSSKWW